MIQRMLEKKPAIPLPTSKGDKLRVPNRCPSFSSRKAPRRRQRYPVTDKEKNLLFQDPGQPHPEDHPCQGAHEHRRLEKADVTAHRDIHVIGEKMNRKSIVDHHSDEKQRVGGYHNAEGGVPQGGKYAGKEATKSSSNARSGLGGAPFELACQCPAVPSWPRNSSDGNTNADFCDWQLHTKRQ